MSITERITNYLGNGGLFNPEMMEHDKVRDLLMDCRERIAELEAELNALAHTSVENAHLRERIAQLEEELRANRPSHIREDG